MSPTMKHKNSKNYRRHYHRRHHHQFINILILSIMWTMLFTKTMARPNLGVLLSNKLANDIAEQQQQQQRQELFLDEIITSANGEKLFNKLQKYHHHGPNYLRKWPGLRDLIVNWDYDDNNDLEESSEYMNTNIFERLRQLASSKSESYDDDNGDTYLMPTKSLKSTASILSNQLVSKDRNLKRNVQYMTPCHFKICNMGRKRDAQYFKYE